ncbi:MAG TPA: hypothetical protein VKB46_28850 [Pyrinomonadaceae bacterium]|nr:hypothetical protein [Pyrinomonadaceae bacterium]
MRKIGSQQLLQQMRLIALGLVCFLLASCAANNENAHTTATTYLPPPPHQVLTVVYKPGAETQRPSLDQAANSTEPSLLFSLENQKTFRVSEEVPIEFLVTNAKLKGDGGEYRVRYIVDDEEMKWVDQAGPFWLSGWTPGKHTIRLELIGPDGWPYKNNVVTKEIEVK